MTMKKAPRNFALLSLCLISAACLVSIAASRQQSHQPVRREDYVGDDKCLSCHLGQKTFRETAHHLTSRLPTEDSIAGKFSEGANLLKTSNPYLYYRMEKTKDGFYQTAVLGEPPNTVTFSRRFDLVIGSARKGQTYLYWGKNGGLFELPVSYWIAPGEWANSPGFEDEDINFDRPVTPRCLECHASYFEPLAEAGAVNRYNKSNYILGISCEKCHGPGREHVARQLSRAAKSSGQAIINPSKLSRDRQIEACALCHGGVGAGKAPAFSYVPGQPLSDYLTLGSPDPGVAIDVHGNQVALLERSRCFQSSAMTCTTCHNVHLPQRNAAAFSRNCLTCHKVESCGMHEKLGQKIADNCVDCHMPKLTSNAIISTTAAGNLQPQVRTHWIKVYPGTSKP
jgi:hypothetical protein